MRESNCSTSCWITEAISSALNLMNTPIDHLLTNGLQLIGDGAVVDGIVDAQHGPADQRRIDDGLQNRPPPTGAEPPAISSICLRIDAAAVVSRTRTLPCTPRTVFGPPAGSPAGNRAARAAKPP